MKSGKKIFWGLFFLVAAALLIAGNFWELPVLDVLVLLVLAVIFVEGIIHRNFPLILFPIAFAVILNSERLGMGEINVWSVLAAALLGSIGLSVLFPRRGRSKKVVQDESDEMVWGESGETAQHESEEVIQNESEGDSIRMENTFGNTVKYVTSMRLSEMRLANTFGNMTVYFTNAVLKDHTAHVRMVTCFGNVILYIPASWNVKVRGDSAFGSIKEKGQCDPNSEDILEIRAGASFGCIEIRYV